MVKPNMSAINIGSGIATKEVLPMTETEYAEEWLREHKRLILVLIRAYKITDIKEAEDALMDHARLLVKMVYGPFAQPEQAENRDE